MPPMRLRVAAAGLVPFLLVALYWQHASSSAAGSDRALVRQQVQRTAVVAAEAAAVAAAAKSSAAAAHATAAPPSASTVATKDTPAPKPGAAAAAATAAAHVVAPAAEARDVALDWGPPTLSSTRIIDGSPNYLPVPNAEGPAPDDMAWRKEVSSDPSVPCPAGRRPYHTILTAQGSLYQQWQTKIFYYHFRKQQAAGGRCTEMTGFTRLLAGKPDELLPTIPTVAVPEAGHNVTRGFPVINRPWSMLLFLDMKEFRERIVERYVYIAETDHLLRHDIPNRATPQLAVGYFFPYMSPKDPKSGGIAQKWLPDTKVADMPPVGPSPILIHVDLLRAVTPLWYELSWKLKRDPEANAAYGWMLEMWGYSIAAARLKIKHFVWQRIQIEPSAAWHQTLSERDGDWAPAVDPFIYHYTFGVEYLLDGSPVVGGKGTWSLDKRNYFGAAPPPDLKAPPECAQEAGRVWWGMFNEAIGNLSKEGQWYSRTGHSTRSRTSDESTELEAAMGALGKELVDSGQWLIGNEKAPLQFFRRGKLWTKWGGGTWRVTGGTKVEMQLCGAVTLTFDSDTAPTRFDYTAGGRPGKGVRDPAFAAAAAAPPDASPPCGSAACGSQARTLSRLRGHGPWALGDAPISGGRTGYAFYRGGVAATPDGAATYRPLPDSADVELSVGGDTFLLRTEGIVGCYQVHVARQRDKHAMKLWVPMRHVSMEYTGWRDSGGCKL